MTDLIMFGLFAVAGISVAYLNIWHYKRRRAMTPEQRRMDDEIIRREIQMW